MSDLSKVNVAQEHHSKNKFNLTHDVNTTFGWGELQPLQCRLIPVGDSKSVFSVSSCVRLAPLVAPTFGRIHFRTWSQFVPCEDVFWNFNHVLSDVPTSNLDSQHSESTTTPTKFPRTTTDFLAFLLLWNCKFAVFHLDLSHTEYTQFNLEPSSSAAHAYFKSAVQAQVSGIDVSSPWYTEIMSTLSADNYDSSINPGACDLMFEYVFQSGSDLDPMVICVNFSGIAKRLRKILIGCGYQTYINSRIDVNVMPLFAFYKAYFDIFGLPQYQNWKTTKLYKILHYIHSNEGSAYIRPDGSYSAGTYQYKLNVLFVDWFLHELGYCIYTEDADYVSSHIKHDSNLPSSDNGEFSNLSVFEPYRVSNNVSTLFQQNGLGPTFKSNSLTFSQLDDDLLKKLYLWINAKSVCGYEIADILRSRGYSSYVDSCKSNYIGSTDLPITIDAVTSQASTASAGGTTGAFLGEYAGKAVGVDKGHNFTYQNGVPGYLITMAAVVPVANYNSALDPTLLGVDAFTFYNPLFEQLGFEQTPRACCGSLSRVQDSQDNYSGVFGLIPRYSGYKVASNVLNGDMSLMSKYDTYGPYQMDRQIILHDFSCEPLSGGQSYVSTDYVPPRSSNTFPNADPEIWRKPTLYPFLGHFDRIFRLIGNEDSGLYKHYWEVGGSDNFICHNIVEFDLYAPMVPIADAWQSVDSEDEPNHRTFSVRK